MQYHESTENPEPVLVTSQSEKVKPTHEVLKVRGARLLQCETLG